jgi:hypothetical protein
MLLSVETEVLGLELGNKFEIGASKLGITLEIGNKFETGKSGIGVCIHRRVRNGGGGGKAWGI